MEEPKEQFSEESEALVRPLEYKNRRKRSIIVFTITSLLSLGLLVLLWTQLLTPAQPTTSPDQGVTNTNDPLIGTMAPNFTLPDLRDQNGKKISLADLKGKPVVLNFWSSTCQPCQKETPLLETQWQRSKAQGVVFVGIDVEDTQSDGLAFLQKYGLTYTTVSGDSSTLVNYAVSYIPETFFINRSGKIVSAVRMQITPQQLQDGLKSILQS